MHNVFGVTLFVSVASGVPFLLFLFKEYWWAIVAVGIFSDREAASAIAS